MGARVDSMSKKEVTLAIDSGALAWAKAVGVNMSRLLDETFLQHKGHVERTGGSNLKNNDGPGRIRTGDLLRVRETS